jgi:DNA helicase II / ATP-dependent DNA helicase PcrA
VKGIFCVAGWEDLSGEQRAAVRHDEGPSAVFAGPGSGKTRVVTLRAARLASLGKRLLVTTFTNDATEEMRARLGKILTKDCAGSAQVTTLHALCLNILRGEGVKFQLLTDAFLQRNLAETAQAAELEKGVAGFLSQLSFQKNSGFTHKTYKHDGSTDDIEFAKAWRAYEKVKAEKGLREFDDLILDVLALLEQDNDLRRRLAAKYTHIIVDECQDMNTPQYGVVFALGRDHKNLMLVGDLDQSLYGFRGADTRTFRQFSANPRTQVYELRENYRSTRSILAFAESLILQDTERRVIAFVPTRPEGEPVTWERYPDPDIEALAVGERILHLHQRGARYAEMVVLYRTNAQSEAFERHFTALEIPFTMREEGDFYARREVQGILAYLNFFAEGESPVPDTNHQPPTTNHPPPTPYPDEWLLAVLNVPNRKISRLTGAQLRSYGEIRGQRIWDILPEFHADDLKTHRGLKYLREELREIAGKLSGIAHAGEAIKIIRAATRFDDWLRHNEKDERDNDRIQNIQRMQAAAAHYPTIGAYLAAVKKVRDESARRKAERKKKRRQQDEVTLATGHSAKGLEWRYVFAVGWSEELLPHRKAEDLGEERRIAYVMATRARDGLAISSVDSWNEATVAPSRFLTGLQLTTPPALENEEAPVEAEPEQEEALGGLFMSV